MAKGSPDSQHELIVTGIGRCLKAAYPQAELSFGTKVPDLGLKPDVFVDHLDGRCWAYEIVNKNQGIREIEDKHRKYTQSGVKSYWILWQTLGPDKPMDDTITQQLMWIGYEVIDAPRRYQLNGLQRTLAHLGDGRLYVFSIHKPLLDLVEHWGLKLVFAGLDVYHIPSDEVDAEWAEGDWEFIPLPYLIFDEQGRPQCRLGADSIPTFLQPFAEPFSSGLVFAREALGELDDLMQAPTPLFETMGQALAQLDKQYGHEKLPQSEELTQALERFQELTTEEMRQEHLADETGFLRGIDALDDLVAALPSHLQTKFRKVMPLTGGMLRQIIELKQWFEEDEHLHNLLTEVESHSAPL